MSILSKTNRFFNHFNSILFYISAALIFLCWLIISLEVFMREFFNLPQTWVVECSEYIMLLTTFFGAAWVLKEEGHIKIEVVLNALGPKGSALLNLITAIIGFFVCAILFIFGIFSVMRAYNEHLVTFTALELPKWPFLTVIPLGTLLLSFQFISRASRVWKERLEKKV